MNQSHFDMVGLLITFITFLSGYALGYCDAKTVWK